MCEENAMKTTSLGIGSMLSATLLLTLPLAQGNVQAGQAPAGVTKIR